MKAVVQGLSIAAGVVGMLVAAAIPAEAAALDVSWTAPVTNADGSALKDLAAYRLYVSTSTPACPSSSYHTVTSSTAAPGQNQRVDATLTSLTAGTTYGVRVSAVDRSGNESACSPTASGVARSTLGVSPTGTVSFGTVSTGGSVDRTFTVQNATSASLSVTASVAAPFSITSGGSGSLAAGASRSVVVRFRSTSSGSFVANVNFTASGETVSRSVSGAATGAISGTSSAPTLSVARSGTGSGTVTSSPAGISCGSDCTEAYADGTRVTLGAAAASGSRFSGWSGSGCSGTGTCAVTMSGSRAVTAIFDRTTTLTAGGPDLVVTGLTLPSAVAPNQSFSVGFNVVNQGSAAAGTATLKMYLSRNTTVSSDDVLLRSRTFGSIPAGGMVSNLLTESLPSSVSGGSYYVLMVIDTGNAVAESNESNNTLARAITVTGGTSTSSTALSPAPSSASAPTSGGPDLVVAGLSLPSTVTRNQGFSVGFNVVNQGSAAAGTATLNMYLSRNTTVSSDDVLLRSRTFGSIPAGGAVSNVLTESVPSSVSAGSYYVLMVIDTGNAVAESNESNNILTRVITVR